MFEPTCAASSITTFELGEDLPSFAHAVDHVYLLGDGSLDEQRQSGAGPTALVYQLRQRGRS